jgi:hypothetical protein
MFYVKTPLSEESVVKTEITDVNVFTRCAGCGKELQVDLDEVFEDTPIALDASVYCCRCSLRRRRRSFTGYSELARSCAQDE